MGQYSVHVPHPVHLSSSTYRGSWTRCASKAPASPSKRSSWVFVIMVIFGFVAHSMNFGDRMHMEQSFVGNVLSS